MSLITVISNAPFEQNNLPKSVDFGDISFGAFTADLEAAIVNKINTLTLNITDKEIPILQFRVFIDNASATKVQKYQLNVGKGFYGTGLSPLGLPRTLIVKSNLILVFDSGNSNNTFTGQDNISKTIYIDKANLSGIGDVEQQIAEYVNTLNYVKDEITSDLWILTNEEEETELPLHYAPVNRNGINNLYTVNNLDDKKFIGINNTVTTINIANVINDEFDCYLYNNNIVGVVTITGALINGLYNNIVINGGVIRIRKNSNNNIIVTGALEVDNSKVVLQIVHNPANVVFALNEGHLNKTILINATVNNISIFVPVNLKDNFTARFIQIGTNLVTFTNQIGVTIVSKSGLSITGQFSECRLLKRNSLTNTFILTGEIKL
jgi:hypothetical protein